MSKLKIPLIEAQQLADCVVNELALVCQRIEIAGSIRRKKQLIGDIEIVCIAHPQLDLFGDPCSSLLSPHLEILVQGGGIIKGDKWGEKYKKFHLPTMPEFSIDLFITTPDEWGYTYTIRTGCAEFSHKLVTPKQHGGFLPGYLKVSNCRLWRDSEALPTPEESDFFTALELAWIPPEQRE